MCLYACVYACMHVCMYVCMYVYVCMCMYVYVYVCVCMCLYVYMYVSITLTHLLFATHAQVPPFESLPMLDKLAGMSIKELVMDESNIFWRALKAVEFLFQPACLVIQVLQHDYMPVSMVPASFIMLHRFYKAFPEQHPEMIELLGLDAASFNEVRTPTALYTLHSYTCSLALPLSITTQ